MKLLSASFLIALLSTLGPAQDWSPPGFGGADSASVVELVSAQFEPSEVAPGSPSELVITLKCAPTWHIYSVLPSKSGDYQPTGFNFASEGLERTGAIVEPTPVSKKSLLYHENTFSLRVPVKVGADAKGTLRSKGTLSFVACDPMRCRPPETLMVRANLKVLAPTSAAKDSAQGSDGVQTDEIVGLDDHARFVVAARPGKATAGSEIVVELRAKVAFNRWGYSALKDPGYASKTEFKIADGEGYSVLPSIEESEPRFKKAKEDWDKDSWIHEGDFWIRRKIVLDPKATGRVVLQGTIDYQTCDAKGCVTDTQTFRLALQVQGEGGSEVSSALSKEALEELHRRFDGLEDRIEVLLPKAKPVPPPAPEYGLDDLEYRFIGKPTAGETTQLEATFTTEEPTQLGGANDVFIDVQAKLDNGKWSASKRIKSIDAVSVTSDAERLSHTVVFDVVAQETARSGEEELELSLSVPVDVKGTSYDIESEVALTAVTFGSPNLWDWIIRAVIAGLLALLTPCVFPMIPVTVSFFTKQSSEGKAASMTLPIVYAVGIVASFIAIGVLFTALTGAGGANTLATNGLVQALFGILFVIFALSLFGAFTLRPPAFLMAKAGAVQGKGGVIGVLGMGLLFSLTTFTCTAPLVGVILVAAAETGEWFLPVVGMAAFAATLALPFFLLALFPKLMSGLPKSGGWMNKVKVTLGFLELAFALKFFGAMDAYYGWEIFTREAILWMWVVMFILNGLYLMNLVSFDSYEERKPVGPISGAIGVILIVFGIHLIGGARGETMPYLVESLMPPRIENPNEGGDYGWSGHAKWSDAPEIAREAAKERGVPLFIDFTGFT